MARRVVFLSSGRLRRPASVLLLALLGLLLAWPLAIFAGPAGLPAAQDAAAVITSPQAGAVVRGSVQIIGSALHPAFQRYELYYTVEPGENWVFIGEAKTTPVSNGLLGIWETGGLPDGSYSLRLRVVHQDGNYDEGYARNVVVANSSAPTATPEVSPTTNPAVAPEATLPLVIENITAPTAGPEPTAVSVEQPDIPTPTPRPSPSPTTTAEAVAVADDNSGAASQASAALGEVLQTSGLRSSFLRGASWAMAIFLAAGVFFGLRRLLTWLWYLIAP